MTNKQLARRLRIICLSLLLLSSIFPALASEKTSSAAVAPSSSVEKKLSNGIYLVLRDGTSQEKVEPIADTEQLIVFDFRFFEPNEREETRYFAVARKPYIPLKLAKEPGKGKDSKGKLKLNLQLSADQVGPLEEFTRKYVGRTIAVVVGGQVVTAHKIRTAITGGRIQITWCEGNACKALYVELQKSIN